MVDYIEYLKPILENVKDGESKLSKADIQDFLMPILEAKIMLSEGHITQAEHDAVMNRDI
jgi:hypothetical protein